jgi:hypothetical protein
MRCSVSDARADVRQIKALAQALSANAQHRDEALVSQEPESIQKHDTAPGAHLPGEHFNPGDKP